MDKFSRGLLAGLAFASVAGASEAWASCAGGDGRGWASGKGDGAFEMAPGAATCLMNYPNVIHADDRRMPATQVTLTRAPKSGKIGLSKQGVVYTPNAGFRGKDRFCTRNTAAAFPGQTLSGCVTVTVR
ncbi:hypothetical protein [Mangrovicoccus ximenensis]|uniref:hypothetical protein n=1 Tax=Mangrovicoccus ximenensis TaxID=1911570 RepID=UPI000D349EE7|nr:hypothetical protein [Mangrovicoccus ximenensis]